MGVTNYLPTGMILQVGSRVGFVGVGVGWLAIDRSSSSWQTMEEKMIELFQVPISWLA